MERITVTVCWVAPDGTLDDLRNAGDDEEITRAAAVAAEKGNTDGSLIFVDATSENV